jgi:hypothetical protein
LHDAKNQAAQQDCQVKKPPMPQYAKQAQERPGLHDAGRQRGEYPAVVGRSPILPPMAWKRTTSIGANARRHPRPPIARIRPRICQARPPISSDGGVSATFGVRVAIGRLGTSDGRDAQSGQGAVTLNRWNCHGQRIPTLRRHQRRMNKPGAVGEGGGRPTGICGQSRRKTGTRTCKAGRHVSIEDESRRADGGGGLTQGTTDVALIRKEAMSFGNKALGKLGNIPDVDQGI